LAERGGFEPPVQV